MINLVRGIFDHGWYLHRNPDVAAAGIDPLEHYISNGAAEGRDPHPLFNTSWYIGNNLDVRRSGINPLLHYVIYGAYEFRDPHPLFDTSWYLDTNPDIGCINPLEHYLTLGAQQARNPHPLFHAAWYIHRNPDVAQSNVNPLVHYVIDGENEGRNPNPLFDVSWYALSYPKGSRAGLGFLAHYATSSEPQKVNPHPLFDSSWYMQQLNGILGLHSSALEHYIINGACNRLDPHPLFNARWYLDTYPEVMAAGLNPLMHYVEEGIGYGTEPHPLFRGAWYKRRYQFGNQINLNPLIHYIQYGSSKNYDPSPSFSSEWYKSRNTDLDFRSINPLVHYVTEGKQQGRTALPIKAQYKEVVAKKNQLLSMSIPELHRHITTMHPSPEFVVVISDTESGDIDETRASIFRQIYRKVTIVRVADLCENIARYSSPNIYLLWLEAGDILNAAALYHFFSAIIQDPSLEIIYADEEVLGDDACDVVPFFKPAWSPDYLESFNYIGRAICYKMSSILRSVFESRSAFELLLRATEVVKSIGHLREIILKCPDRRTGSEVEISADLALLNQRCQRMGRNAVFVTTSGRLRLYRAVAKSYHSSRVTAIIFDLPQLGGRRVTLPTALNESLAGLPVLDYPGLEIIDARSEDSVCGAAVSNLSSRSGEYLADGRLAKILNAAISSSKGEYILFLNGRLRPAASDFLTNMVQHFTKSHVGAVGSKILMDDNRICEFGQIFCNDFLQDVHCGIDQTTEEYFFSRSAARNFRTASMNAFLTSKDLLTQMRGFDEGIHADFMVADYCLRLAGRGLSVVCEPGAQLIGVPVIEMRNHYCCQTNLSSDAVFYSRWGSDIAAEPYYNDYEFMTLPATYDGRQRWDKDGYV